jgi:hypothetical protein
MGKPMPMSGGDDLSYGLPYPRLTGFLLGLSDSQARIAISFGFIQEVAGEELPLEALLPSWWTNDPSEPQSDAWLAAGWEIDEIIPSGGIAFARDELGVHPGR